MPAPPSRLKSASRWGVFSMMFTTPETGAPLAAVKSYEVVPLIISTRSILVALSRSSL